MTTEGNFPPRQLCLKPSLYGRFSLDHLWPLLRDHRGIAAPGVETDVPFTGPGYVRGIWKIQWKDPYFIGTHFDGHGTRAFIHDTRTRATTTPDPGLDTNEVTEEGSKNLDAWIAAQTQTHFDADSYWVMYAKNRRRWPNYEFLTLVLLGEAAIGFWLWRTWSGFSTKVAESAVQ